jgi:hypothetical protein
MEAVGLPEKVQLAGNRSDGSPCVGHPLEGFLKLAAAGAAGIVQETVAG